MHRLVVGALAASVAISGAESQTPARTPVLRTLTAAEARTDFRTLRAALEEAHGGMYRFVPKATIDNSLTALEKSFRDSVPPRTFLATLSDALASLRDGHSNLPLDHATRAYLQTVRQFPLGVAIEGSSLVVVSNNTASDSTIRPGMEILRINGRDPDAVVPRLMRRVSGDGFIETGRRRRLERSFAATYWLFEDPSDTFAILARDAEGDTVRVTLSGIGLEDRERNAQSNPVNARYRAAAAEVDGPRDNVSLRYLSRDVAYLKIRAFWGDQYATGIDTSFRSVRDQGSPALILDLRGNGGGVDDYGARLVARFVNRPFRYFDRIHIQTLLPSFARLTPQLARDLETGSQRDPAGGFLATPALHSGVGLQQPGPDAFLGRLYVLIDGGTFSTAADAAALIRSLTNATFIGEETGGTAIGNTSGLSPFVVLPNSGLRVPIQMYQYWNAIDGGVAGRGTLPHVTVERRVSDTLLGRDAALERAIALARADLSRVRR